MWESANRVREYNEERISKTFIIELNFSGLHVRRQKKKHRYLVPSMPSKSAGTEATKKKRFSARRARREHKKIWSIEASSFFEPNVCRCHVMNKKNNQSYIDYRLLYPCEKASWVPHIIIQFYRHRNSDFAAREKYSFSIKMGGRNWQKLHLYRNCIKNREFDII